MTIKHSIRFLLHKRDSSQSTNLGIRMRVTVSKQRPIDFLLAGKVDEQNWNAETERVFERAKDSVVINQTIEEYRITIGEVFARYELIEKRVPTTEEVKELFNDMVGKAPVLELNAEPNFYRVFDKFVSSMSDINQWTPATVCKFTTLRNKFTGFDPKLTFSAFDEDKAQKFITYLSRQGYRNTTIAKNIAYVRWFLRWASNQGLYQGNLHDTFRPKFKGTTAESKEIIYLSREEVQQLQDYQFRPNEDALERVRDVFLFCCFTGLRYSDVAKLRRSDVKRGYISVVTQKTVDGLKIEFNKHSRAILDKYKDCDFPNDNVLPIISNEKMNEHLKRLGQVAGLEEPTRVVYFKGIVRHEEVYPKWALLTTHCGRRTFVVLALQLGIPPEVIMKWTGHSSFEAMKPYTKIVDELKQRSMSKFDDL